MKLSPAQQRFMDQVDTDGESRPPAGYPSAGRDASAWHRTAKRLSDMGLVNVQRGAHSFRAVKTLTLAQKTEGFESRWATYMKKLARLDELRAKGLYGYQLSAPKAALSQAREELERFCATNGFEAPRAGKAA